MRILIAWADDSSANLGVRALGQGSVDLLRQVWPEAEFTSITYGRRPREIPWGTDRGLILERITGGAGMQRWLGKFDLLWDTRAGDSFADIYGNQRLRTMSLVHEFAVQAGVRAVMAPQTIGPFGSLQGRLLAKRSLGRSSLVFARDPKSAEAATRLGRAPDATASDLAFGIDQPKHPERHDVLLNVSGLLWGENNHVDARGYQQTVREIIDRLLADGRDVTLIPHVIEERGKDNDIPVSQELASRYKGRLGVRVPTDLADVRSAIAGANVVIGARMHACLNALSTGTPGIAMAYSRKFAPLMSSLGWDRVVQIGSSHAADSVLQFVNDPAIGPEALSAQERGQSMLRPVVESLRDLR